jgi:hypothetical protein
MQPSVPVTRKGAMMRELKKQSKKKNKIKEKSASVFKEIRRL